jgi:hypothetical protein
LSGRRIQGKNLRRSSAWPHNSCRILEPLLALCHNFCRTLSLFPEDLLGVQYTNYFQKHDFT